MKRTVFLEVVLGVLFHHYDYGSNKCKGNADKIKRLKRMRLLGALINRFTLAIWRG